jgi:hypothetical protein
MNQSTPFKTYTKGNKTLEIFADNDPQNPREDENLSTMVCLHNRYSLGDKHSYKQDDYNSWDEMKEAIIKKEKTAIILPLYLYDHSGITIRTTPFGDRWDSGQVGFVFISKEKIRTEYGVKRITKFLIDRVTFYIKSEVKTYDQYLTGDVYGFKLLENGEETDSCWGFFGSDVLTNGILDNLNDVELVEHIKG